MANDILNSLLREYEQKKLKAELDLEDRKEDLYKKIPKLQEIENELNTLGINTAKNILLNNSSTNNLTNRIEQLKHEKLCILKMIRML